jgi:CBS domain-containing protein
LRLVFENLLKLKGANEMKVSEIMSTPIEEVMDNDTVIRAARKMRDLDVGVLTVKSQGNILAGMLTDRDIVIRGIAQELDPEKTLVSDIMTSGVFSCSANQTTEDAAAVMADAKVRRLVVVDEEDGVVGIISLGDVAVKGTGRETAGATIDKISRPDQQ